MLLTARGGQTKNGVCDIQTADGSFDVYVHVGFEAEDARLTLDDSGYAYVCGTDRDNGQNITAVVRVVWMPEKRPLKDKSSSEIPIQGTGGNNMNTDIVIVGAARRASSPRSK